LEQIKGSGDQKSEAIFEADLLPEFEYLLGIHIDEANI